MRRRRSAHLTLASVVKTVVVIVVVRRVLKGVANVVATHAVKSVAMGVVVIAIVDPKVVNHMREMIF
jgi:hypothetical protein